MSFRIFVYFCNLHPAFQGINHYEPVIPNNPAFSASLRHFLSGEGSAYYAGTDSKQGRSTDG
jgi:hypothetical protein